MEDNASEPRLHAPQAVVALIERFARNQDAYVESFIAILRRESLNWKMFCGVLEAQVKTESWRRRYSK